MLKMLSGRSDIALALAVIGIITVLIIPIPTMLLDFALAFNITFSLVVLLTTLYIQRPLDLSVFPGMLLLLTLMRLSLNVASTRLILADGYAGQVIESFGHFVVQGNYVVGGIIFIILVIIQFIVITKGAGRISEVAARFTLDAMPGKQMAIDADLNAGILSESEARRRREEIAREADFYGAMDGASKFVRGDAIAGILITLINIIGGFVIGVAMRDMPFADALKSYTLMSIGDGLVTQIPALLVSTASGIIVTRAASTSHMGADLSKQISSQPRAIMVAAGVLVLFGMVPGMPTVTFLALGGLVGGLGWMSNQAKNQQAAEATAVAEKKTTPPPAPERTEDLLKVDILGLEIGYGLIPLVDVNQGGDLLERIGAIRKQLASELGIIVPPVRIRDNVRLTSNGYQIKLKGMRASEFEIMTDYVLAINPGHIDESLEGFNVSEPAFGLRATWILPVMRDMAEARGFTVVTPSAVIATHLTEIVRQFAAEMLTRQDVRRLVDTLKEDSPALVDTTIPDVVSLGSLQKVLQNLLNERIAVRDLATIVETLSDYAPITKDTDVLSEYVRMSLKRQITEMYKDGNGQINVFTIDPALEQQLAESVQSTKQGFLLVIDPVLSERLASAISVEIQRLLGRGLTAILLCSPNLRLALRRHLDSSHPTLAILSYNELLSSAHVISSGTVRLSNDR
jgi:flagellar biosynthesis protein FlhA